MIVAPAANAMAALGSVGGKAISTPQFSAAAGKRGMSNKIALPPLSLLDEPGNVRHRLTAEGPTLGGDSSPNDPPGGRAVSRTPAVGGAADLALSVVAPKSLVGEHCCSRRSVRRLRRLLPKVPHQSVPKSTITTWTQQPLPPLHRR